MLLGITIQNPTFKTTSIIKQYTDPLSCYIIVTVLLLLGSSTTVWAQQDSSQVESLSNWRSKSYFIQGDTLVLDDRPVFPTSITIKSTHLVADSTFIVQGNQLIFVQLPIDTVLTIRYRVFPYNLQEKKQHKNIAAIGRTLQHDGLIGSGYRYNPYVGSGDAFQFGDLDYSGVFARGLSVGNNQDLILNSSFNLQVAGKLGDVEILGAISDNNVPLQPEGNTQQLDEFDRIFVQFKYGRQRLIAGDYNIARPKSSYFMNYYRRLQGGQAFTNLKVGKGRLKTDASFAVSKGKFARQQLKGEEGNQGPYRLKGANGEPFVIVIAGTERVYIDGKVLTRGADNDYTIDYNLGEITFTPQQLITKDRRIQIEFSYTDLTFLRTIVTANTAYETKQGHFRFNLYSEQDAKGQTVAGALSDSAKAVLQRVGDATDQAFVSGISIPDQTGKNKGVIFYELKDSLVNGILYDSVLVFSNNKDVAIYNARFSAIASGGNYIRVQGSANGVVYQWVAPNPLTGKPTGTHAPVRLLNTPKQRQLYNLGVDHQIGKNGSLSADIALSNVDENTFSEVGNEDNQGLAARLTYQQTIPLAWKKGSSRTVDSLLTTKTSLKIEGHYEYLMKTFEFVEPYRTREFARDWNIQVPEKTQEHLYKAKLTLTDKYWGQMSYQFSGLNKEMYYQGTMQTLAATVRHRGFLLKTNSSLLQSNTPKNSSMFVRPKLDVSYTFKKLLNWKIGAYGELEQNNQVDLVADTLQQASFFYHLSRAYTELPASKKLFLKAAYTRRYDYLSASNFFVVNAIADAVQVSGDWEQSRSSRLQWNMTYRNLNIIHKEQSNQKNKETYLGRLEYLLNIKRGFIRSSTIYQLGSGQQQKVEYNYVKVDQGKGTFIWVDRNGDEAQQIDEFEKAQFQDQADYIRVTLLTGKFIRTNNVLFSQSLTIRPKVLIQAKRRKQKHQKKKKLPFILDALQRFSTRSILKIDRKTFDGARGVIAFNPFQLDVAHEALVTISSGINNNVYFNRTGTYGWEFSQRDNRSKTLLSTGFETRNFREYSLNQRLNIKPSKRKLGIPPSTAFRNLRFQASLLTSLGQQSNSSQFFPTRDYDVRFYKVQPQFTALFQKKFRVILQYKYQYKKNEISTLDQLHSHDITTELHYNQAAKTNVKASFSFVQMQFDGEATSPVGYTMTEGLQAGSNYLWKLSLSQALSRNIQLTFSYEGRKTGGTVNVVHVGRAEIRATF